MVPAGVDMDILRGSAAVVMFSGESIAKVAKGTS